MLEKIDRYLKQGGRLFALFNVNSITRDTGLEGTLEASGEHEVVLASEDGRHTVSRSVAETVSVRADPAPPARPPLPEQLVLSSDRYGR